MARWLIERDGVVERPAVAGHDHSNRDLVLSGLSDTLRV
jgi:hypothetical protein